MDNGIIGIMKEKQISINKQQKLDTEGWEWG
jgi:hypothetical protein